MKAWFLAAALLVGGAPGAQSSSTAPVVGPSPGYPVPTEATTSGTGWRSRQVGGVVKAVLPGDPYAGGERTVVVDDARGNEHKFRLDSTTLILKNGVNLSFNSVGKGDKVEVTSDTPPGDDGSVAADYVLVTP